MADGTYSFYEIFKYIDAGVFPGDLRKEEKLALRKRAKFIQVIDGTLY